MACEKSHADQSVESPPDKSCDETKINHPAPGLQGLNDLDVLESCNESTITDLSYSDFFPKILRRSQTKSEHSSDVHNSINVEEIENSVPSSSIIYNQTSVVPRKESAREIEPNLPEPIISDCPTVSESQLNENNTEMRETDGYFLQKVRGNNCYFYLLL